MTEKNKSNGSDVKLPVIKPSGEELKQHIGRRNFKKPIIRQPKFEGRCEELKGHIYDCSDARQADMFVKTTKEIAEYVGRTYKYGSDARLAIDNMKRPKIQEPDDPKKDATATQKKIWEKRIDEYVKREGQLEENLKTVYSLVWGQCTDALKHPRQSTNQDVRIHRYDAQGAT